LSDAARALAACLRVLAEELSGCASGLVSRALRGAAGALGGDVFCAYAWLRLGFEAAGQHAYYALLGIEWSEALERISRRSRFAASFTASMVKGLRGVHGSRRKWLLRTYLRLNEWLHPSIALYRAGGVPVPDAGLVRSVADSIAYLCSLAGVEPGEEAVRSCGLEKTWRLLERRHG